jgi:hypothetical protein
MYPHWLDKVSWSGGFVVEYKKIITLSVKHEGSTVKSLLKTFVHFVP